MEGREGDIYFLQGIMSEVYKVSYSPKWRGGGLIKCVGEEYQVVKRGRKYNGFGEEYNMEKGKGESISS
jgi:hypothetical protein